jgi:hypothetical protein
LSPRGVQVVRNPDAVPGPATDPRGLGAICAQCHSAPSPRFPDGSAARNSSEALAMAAGACASAIRCVDCHDPHVRGPDPGSGDRADHLAACVGCHRELAPPPAQAAHAGHAPGDATCLDCHLPRLVQGLTTYVRSHRISSPTDPRMLAVGAPNACNLCHLDRSIAWTAAALAALGQGDRRPAPDWAAAYGGDLDYAVGLAWLRHPEDYVRMTAAAAFARAGDPAALPALVAGLDDVRANTRMWMVFAIEALVGRRLTRAEYDPLAPPALRARQASRPGPRGGPPPRRVPRRSGDDGSRAPRRAERKAQRRRATLRNSRSCNAAHGDASAAWRFRSPGRSTTGSARRAR